MPGPTNSVSQARIGAPRLLSSGQQKGESQGGGAGSRKALNHRRAVPNPSAPFPSRDPLIWAWYELPAPNILGSGIPPPPNSLRDP